MKNPVIKGNKYYELQILMFVFMWQWNMDLPVADRPITRGIRIGRFYVWYDTAWKSHGFALRWIEFWHKVFEYILPPWKLIWESDYKFFSIDLLKFVIIFKWRRNYLGDHPYKPFSFRIGNFVFGIAEDSEWMPSGFLLKWSVFWQPLFRNTDKFKSWKTKLQIIKMNAGIIVQKQKIKLLRLQLTALRLQKIYIEFEGYFKKLLEERESLEDAMNSLEAYFHLARGGFRITRGSLGGANDNLIIHRFWWHGLCVPGMELDIDQIGKTFYSRTADNAPIALVNETLPNFAINRWIYDNQVKPARPTRNDEWKAFPKQYINLHKYIDNNLIPEIKKKVDDDLKE